MTTLPRLRRHTDGRVALCLTGDLWSVTATGPCTTWWVNGDAVSGEGRSELFVAELPEPDGWDVTGLETKEPRWDAVNGKWWAADDGCIDHEHDGQIQDIDGVRSAALKMLAAVAACERYRAEREATT